MKFRKWTVILSAIVSLCVLIAASLFSARLISRLALPIGFNNGQFESNHPLLGRYGTFASSFGMLFVFGISGILILYIIPARVRCVADTFSVKLSHLLRLTFLGFLIEVLVVFVGIGSALTIGTFPLTILLVGAAFIIGLVGFISLAYAVGQGMLRIAQWQNNSPIYSMLLGLLILLAIVPIPVLGGVFFLAFTSLGFGAMIMSHFGSGDPWTLTPLLEK
ncbi:MAG: hypothetical protein ABIF04_02490 [Chloroflexota bacterium]